MTMREKMARAYFSKEKARMLRMMDAFNGGRAIKTWPPKDRAEYLAVERMKWEDLQQRDHDEFFSEVDTALDALMEPTEGMRIEGCREYAASGSADRPIIPHVFSAMIRAAKEGK